MPYEVGATLAQNYGARVASGISVGMFDDAVTRVILKVNGLEAGVADAAGEAAPPDAGTGVRSGFRRMTAT